MQQIPANRRKGRHKTKAKIDPILSGEECDAASQSKERQSAANGVVFGFPETIVNKS